MEKILNKLKYSGKLGLRVALLLYKPYRYFHYSRLKDDIYLKKKFIRVHGYELDLKNPKTLNEKIQWLKINDRRKISTVLADKYLVREFILKNFGDQYLIPLILETKNTNDLNADKLPNFPFIIKTNHDSGHYLIVRDKTKINWSNIRTDFKWWLSQNYFDVDREWPYKNIKPRIVVEKLLILKNGKIPNDYKLHCINGKVAFVYVSIDRENVNKRNIYSKSWKPLNFTLANSRKKINELRGEEIMPPKSYKKMIEFAEKIAELYPYVRVDFYDVDGKLYFGEVTHLHGGGNDLFNPVEWDRNWGKMINLNYGIDKVNLDHD